MRINGGVVLLAIPIIAVLMFGISVSWDHLEVVDPVLTGAIR